MGIKTIKCIQNISFKAGTKELLWQIGLQKPQIDDVAIKCFLYDLGTCQNVPTENIQSFYQPSALLFPYVPLTFISAEAACLSVL